VRPTRDSHEESARAAHRRMLVQLLCACLSSQATGRSLNILPLALQPRHKHHRLLNVETSPGTGAVSVFDTDPGTWLFHANAYQRLPVPEQVRLTGPLYARCTGVATCQTVGPCSKRM